MKRILKKAGQLLRDNRGISQMTVLIILMASLIFLAAMLVVTNIFTKHDVAVKDFQKAIKICQTSNLDKQYNSMIEVESYDGSVNYSSAAYTDAFYSALQNSFAHVDATVTAGGHSYQVYSKSGQQGFTLRDVSLSASVADVTIGDTKEKRLVYVATGTLLIPLQAFGYTSNISVPVKATASFQYTG